MDRSAANDIHQLTPQGRPSARRVLPADHDPLRAHWKGHRIQPEPSAAPTQSWDMLGQFLNGMHMHMQVWYSNIGLENQESQKGHHLDMLVFKVQRL